MLRQAGKAVIWAEPILSGAEHSVIGQKLSIDVEATSCLLYDGLGKGNVTKGSLVGRPKTDSGIFVTITQMCLALKFNDC